MVIVPKCVQDDCIVGYADVTEAPSVCERIRSIVHYLRDTKFSEGLARLVQSTTCRNPLGTRTKGSNSVTKYISFVASDPHALFKLALVPATP